jgi:hypothetical protein
MQRVASPSDMSRLLLLCMYATALLCFLNMLFDRCRRVCARTAFVRCAVVAVQQLGTFTRCTLLVQGATALVDMFECSSLGVDCRKATRH